MNSSQHRRMAARRDYVAQAARIFAREAHDTAEFALAFGAEDASELVARASLIETLAASYEREAVR